MRQQHLSDEAIAAFADDVLRGGARDRATRHTAACAECKHAVAVQREAVWALRAAPAPALPSGLLDRLREVPSTTTLTTVPAASAPDGSPMFAAFGSVSGAAALAPETRDASDDSDTEHRTRGMRPFAMTAAALAVASALGVGGVTYLTSEHESNGSVPAHTRLSPDDQTVRLAHLMQPGRTR